MPKKVSIVIPVYNAMTSGGGYIHRCIQSVLGQRNFDSSDIEILIINDGSKDDSFEVLQQIERENKGKITLINQTNKGAAKTRNKAIDLAKGEYLTFLDQDDWIDSDYLSTLYKSIISQKTDVVQSGFKLVSQSGMVKDTVMPVNKAFGKFLAIPAWAKIYRTRFLQENNIKFFSNNIGEDSIFTVDIIKKATYATINHAGYNNSFDNSTNVTNSLHKGLSKEVNIIGLMEELKNKTLTPGSGENDLYEYNIIRTASYYLLSYGSYATPQRFIETNGLLNDWMKENIPRHNTNKYVWLSPKGERASASLGVKIIMILNKARLVPFFARIYCKGR